MANTLPTEESIVYRHQERKSGFKKFEVKATLIEDDETKWKHLEFWFDNFRDAKNIFGYDQTKHQGIVSTEEFKNLAKMIEFIQLEII